MIIIVSYQHDIMTPSLLWHTPPIGGYWFCTPLPLRIPPIYDRLTGSKGGSIPYVTYSQKISGKNFGKKGVFIIKILYYEKNYKIN